jgi:NADH-quinone oxidoreductase subunit C
MSPAKQGPQPPAPDDPITLAAAALLDRELPGAVEETVASGLHPHLVLAVDRLRDACLLLRDHDDTQLDCCHLISGVDRPDDGLIEVVYHLVSYARRPDDAYRKREGKNDAWVALKVRVPRERPEVPSVADVWTGADWHERETYDLVGVVFTGRAELRRILLPEDWPGHPLRKDWEFPVGYHGVPIIPPEAQP